jgi:omega-amidase
MLRRMAPILKKPVKIGLVQLAAGADKTVNLQRAREKVLEASKAGAKIVVLPASLSRCHFFHKAIS